MTIIFRTLEIFFNFLEILIIIRVFMSIFRVSYDNMIGKFIIQLTEPIMGPAKSILHKLGLDRMMIDFSPWLAILILRIAYLIILNILR